VEKLLIWGNEIPFNSGKSKLMDLEIHEEYTMEDLFRNHPGVFDSSKDYVEDLSGNETMVYREEILTGKAKETYEDEPYLIPYLVPGSDRCVISCPGGAYLSKSMDNEGEDVAAFLNQAGISCFVLWYRSYPYRTPVMFRDCQRAIRYVRYHAKDYGIHPEKIGIVGFSAGGNLCGTTVEIFRNTPVEAEGYIPDEIDRISAHVNALGLVYPAVTFEYSKVFLECIEKKEVVKDPAMRAKLAEHYTLKNHIQENDPPTFLCSAIDDILIPPLQICEYAQALKRCNVPFELHIFETGGHGFGGCNPLRVNPMFPADLSRAEKWKELFTSWINKQFES
jgi:acetyl esterase/lipase